MLRRRRMTRNFDPTPIDPGIVDELLDRARRAPSAGNTAAVDFVVLEGPAQTGAYWDTTLPEAARSSFPWPGLLRAPVLVVVWVDPAAYVSRYGESDKAHTGLGVSADDWPVPYWFVDGGAAVMSLLLDAEAHELGALFFGLFEHEEAVRRRFGVPEGRRAVGTVALGQRAPDRPSVSAARPRPDRSTVIHRGSW
ncbi:MAG: nitroreductase family protein [Acidimicrobiales bacterium]